MKITDTQGNVVADGTRSQRVRLAVGVRDLAGEHLAPGEHVLPDYFAALLIGSGRAVAVEGAVVVEPAKQPDVVQVADPAPVHRDPKPARRALR